MNDDPRRPVSSGSAAPPPRRSSGAPAAPLTALPADPGSTRSATVVRPETAPVSPTASTGGGGSRRDRRAVAEAAPKPPARSRAPWWLRVIAWVLAVPLGLVLVGIPARKLGYLDSQKLLDIVIGKDTGRYLPLVVIVLLWAVVTAVLVQCIVEGGGLLLRRRRARRSGASAAV
jgi:hypothetical protein